MSSAFHLLNRFKTEQKIKQEEQKKTFIKNVEDRVINYGSHKNIINMRDAYTKVRNSSYEPSEAEIRYRQLFTSSFVKH